MKKRSNSSPSAIPAAPGSIPVHCAHDAVVSVSDLKPHPKNPNRHPAEQIALLAKVISHRGWRAPIVISTRSGFIVAGHGRLDAALKLGCKEVPVDYQEFASDADEVAHLVADNKLAELAETDNDVLTRLLEEDVRGSGLDVALAGILESIEDGEVEKVSLPPAPRMTWVLIGIPTPRFGEINEAIESIARVEGTLCEVAAATK